MSKAQEVLDLIDQIKRDRLAAEKPVGQAVLRIEVSVSDILQSKGYSFDQEPHVDSMEIDYVNRQYVFTGLTQFTKDGLNFYKKRWFRKFYHRLDGTELEYFSKLGDFICGCDVTKDHNAVKFYGKVTTETGFRTYWFRDIYNFAFNREEVEAIKLYLPPKNSVVKS